jgi:hypothetical protein
MKRSEIRAAPDVIRASDERARSERHKPQHSVDNGIRRRHCTRDGGACNGVRLTKVKNRG